MTRRTFVIFLHWPSVFLILTMVNDSVSKPWVLALFVAFIALWPGLTLIKGLMRDLGPKLSAPLKRAYPWMHAALHVLLALSAALILFRLLGQPLRFFDTRSMLLVALAAGTLHGIFHFWRHTTLYDDALDLILPRFMHRML